MQPVVDFGKLRDVLVVVPPRSTASPKAEPRASPARARAYRDDPGGLRGADRHLVAAGAVALARPRCPRWRCSSSSTSASAARGTAAGARRCRARHRLPRRSVRGLATRARVAHTRDGAWCSRAPRRSRLDVATPVAHDGDRAASRRWRTASCRSRISSPMYAGDATAALRLVPTTAVTTALIAPLAFRCLASSRSPPRSRSARAEDGRERTGGRASRRAPRARTRRRAASPGRRSPSPSASSCSSAGCISCR